MIDVMRIVTAPGVFKARCRETTRAVPLDVGILVRLLDSDLKMLLPKDDLSLTPCITLDGFWEMDSTLAILHFVKPGMRAFDVGAHCGYFTLLLAALVGPTGHVHAFEPQLDLAQLLDASLRVNALDNVEIARAAAGTGGERWLLPASSSQLGVDQVGRQTGSTRVVSSRILNAPPVPSVRLDSLPMPDFVKIDVEATEHNVWDSTAGWRRSSEWSTRRPTMLVEVTGYQPELIQAFRDAGYDPRAVGRDGRLEPLKPTASFTMVWLQGAA